MYYLDTNKGYDFLADLPIVSFWIARSYMMESKHVHFKNQKWRLFVWCKLLKSKVNITVAPRPLNGGTEFTSSLKEYWLSAFEHTTGYGAAKTAARRYTRPIETQYVRLSIRYIVRSYKLKLSRHILSIIDEGTKHFVSTVWDRSLDRSSSGRLWQDYSASLSNVQET